MVTQFMCCLGAAVMFISHKFLGNMILMFVPTILYVIMR